MQLQERIVAVESRLAKFSQNLSNFDEASSAQQVYHILDELTSICKLLSSGTSDLAQKTSWLTAACAEHTQHE